MKRILNIRVGNASIGWYLRQLLPLTYWTVSTPWPAEAFARDEDRHMAGRTTLTIWRMWLGCCYNVTIIPAD